MRSSNPEEGMIEVDRPLVSLCLRSHNQKRFFRAALRGAFDQDYSPLEICITIHPLRSAYTMTQVRTDQMK